MTTSAETCFHCGANVGAYDKTCGSCGKGLSGAALLAANRPAVPPAAARSPLHRNDSHPAPTMSGAAKFFWAMAIVGAVFGALQLVMGEASATGAPQQAASAAMACATAVVPYVLARAVDELTRSR